MPDSMVRRPAAALVESALFGRGTGRNRRGGRWQSGGHFAPRERAERDDSADKREGREARNAHPDNSRAVAPRPDAFPQAGGVREDQREPREVEDRAGRSGNGRRAPCECEFGPREEEREGGGERPDEECRPDERGACGAAGVFHAAFFR